MMIISIQVLHFKSNKRERKTIKESKFQNKHSQSVIMTNVQSTKLQSSQRTALKEGNQSTKLTYMCFMTAVRNNVKCFIFFIFFYFISFFSLNVQAIKTFTFNCCVSLKYVSWDEEEGRHSIRNFILFFYSSKCH